MRFHFTLGLSSNRQQAAVPRRFLFISTCLKFPLKKFSVSKEPTRGTSCYSNKHSQDNSLRKRKLCLNCPKRYRAAKHGVFVNSYSPPPRQGLVSEGIRNPQVGLRIKCASPWLENHEILASSQGVIRNGHSPRGGVISAMRCTLKTAICQS